MYNSLGLTKGLSFVRILGGLSKTLQVANQIIPLYQKARPAIHNARNMLHVLKEFQKSDTKVSVKEEPTIAPIKKEKILPKEKTSATPTFFL